MGVSRAFSNFLLGLADGIASFGGYDLEIVVDDHEIEFSFVDSEDLDRRAYDGDHYVNGNIFRDGYANPIKPVLDDAEDEVELIRSDRYKDYMNQKLVREMVKATEGRQGGNILLLVTAFASIISAGILIMLMVTVMG